MKTLLRFLTVYLVLSVFASVALLVHAWPRTPAQWLYSFLFALPCTLVLEAFGYLISDNRLSRYVEARTPAQAFSGLRVLVHLVFALLTVAALIGLGFGFLYLKRLSG